MSFFKGFRFAAEGLVYVFHSQRNFRVHLAVTIGVGLVGLWLRLPLLSWAILALTVSNVLVTEIFNTAAESLIDLVSPGYHPIAKRVKDLTAGAVLIAAIVSVVVGLLILGPPLLARLGFA
ncbi:MAG: diacylglycerol kinase family protein [Anaerolineae bacterium]|nr:diacylglycerol kinase family protein [Anaerolineae bacterium]